MRVEWHNDNGFKVLIKINFMLLNIIESARTKSRPSKNVFSNGLSKIQNERAKMQWTLSWIAMPFQVFDLIWPIFTSFDLIWPICTSFDLIWPNLTSFVLIWPHLTLSWLIFLAVRKDSSWKIHLYECRTAHADGNANGVIPIHAFRFDQSEVEISKNLDHPVNYNFMWFTGR